MKTATLTIRELTTMAMLVALNVVLSYIVKIPTPTGFVSLVEVGIFLAAWQGGPRAGALVGVMTGVLLDVISGYPQWVFFSGLIHGAEGWCLGHARPGLRSRLAYSCLAGCVMVGGYWLAGTFLLWLAGPHLSWPVALTTAAFEIPLNSGQVIVGGLVAALIQPFLKGIDRKKEF